MIIYCILGIVSDFILGNYFTLNYKYIYIIIIYSLNEILIFCFLKYMMDKLYYQYMEAILYWGITGLFGKIIIFSSLSINEYRNDKNEILGGIKYLFTETNIYGVIFYQLFYYILYGGIHYTLVILMLYYLKPNHKIVTDELDDYQRMFFNMDESSKYYSLIPFVFQILALLFYFEILELNFLDLNKNTIKNIQEREGKDKERKNTVQSVIELTDEYYLKDDDLPTDHENK